MMKGRMRRRELYIIGICAGTIVFGTLCGFLLFELNRHDVRLARSIVSNGGSVRWSDEPWSCDLSLENTTYAIISGGLPRTGIIDSLNRLTGMHIGQDILVVDMSGMKHDDASDLGTRRK